MQIQSWDQPSSSELRTHPHDFDFYSLTFDEPGFTFFHAQEFFVSKESTCNEPIQNPEDFKQIQVPVDVKAKKLNCSSALLSNMSRNRWRPFPNVMPHSSRSFVRHFSLT